MSSAGRKGHATLGPAGAFPRPIQEEVEVNSTARGSEDEGAENAAAAARAALRVAIIESQPATRIGLETILERAGLVTVLSSATVAEAIAALAGLRCEVALVGTIADATPADAVRRIREQFRAEVVVIGDPRHANEGRAILRSGASGQIARDAAPAAIVAAVHAAASGLAAMDPAVLEAMLGSEDHPDGPRSRDEPDDLADAPAAGGGGDAPLQRTAADPAARPEAAEAEGPRPTDPEMARAARRVTDALSPRERELLRYLAEGYTNKEIARVMVLADDTVKKGVQSLIAKLGAADRTHAVVLALRSGLIQ